MGKQQRVRFAIGSEAGICSEVWTCWTKGSDFYLTNSGMKGEMKISFHESGICHYAAVPEFFAEHREAFGREDRTSLRWRRPATPEKGPLLAMFFVFAAYESWEPFWEYEDKAVTILSPPEHGLGKIVSVLYSREDPDNHCAGAPPSDVYIARFQLANGDFVTLVPSFPTELPRDTFDERPIRNRLMLSHVDPSADDHRNVAILDPVLLSSEGPLQVLSLHNMRMRSVPIEEYERSVGRPGVFRRLTEKLSGRN
jgi:hypothetical protein